MQVVCSQCATQQNEQEGRQEQDQLSEELKESEKLISVMSETWEEKLVKTERVQHERQKALETMGISVQASGIKVDVSKFYLFNQNVDPSLNQLLIYYLKVGPPFLPRHH